MSGVIERAKVLLRVAENDGFGCKCEARSQNECGCSGVKWVNAHDVAAVIHGLLAIVERLPQTADGVPVVPGMDLVYSWHDDGPVRTATVNGENPAWAWGGSCGPVYEIGRCYSTRAAAEAARSKL